MSDEEETPVAKKARIFYGSLEEKERERLGREGGAAAANDAVKAGIEAGHINISSGLCFHYLDAVHTGKMDALMLDLSSVNNLLESI